jgi:GNAT superfamily N-acetyltransferase
MRSGALWEVHEAQAEPLDAALHELLGRADALVIVGAIDDAVVGYGIVVIEVLRDGTALGVIRELFVEPDARAVGVGEAIAEQLVTFCRDRQCVGITPLPYPAIAKQRTSSSGRASLLASSRCTGAYDGSPGARGRRDRG